MVQLVAIECSTATASVALVRGHDVVEHCFAPDSRQSERILLAIDQLTRSSGFELRATDAIAVSIGPGAFTGVRLAIAAAQGLALALSVPIVPVSTLAVLALSIDAPPGGEPIPVLATMDARMGEIYAGWFDVTRTAVTARGAEAVLSAAQLTRPEDVGRYTAVGNGFGAFPAEISAVIGEPLTAFPDRFPRAADVARLAQRCWPHGAMPPEQIEAAYLRNKVALTTAERQVA